MSALSNTRATADTPNGSPETVSGDFFRRSTSTERILHWWVVCMFAAALLTGLAMGDEAESGPLLRAHIGAVVLIGAGVVVGLIVGNTRALLSSAWDLFHISRVDVAWALGSLRHPFRAHHVRWGKFNVGQKVMAWSLVGSLTAVVVTGLQSWHSGGDSAGPHSAAVALTCALLAAHVFMAVVNPTTRPAFPGMVLGHVRRSWAAKHHAGWLDEVDAKG